MRDGTLSHSAILTFCESPRLDLEEPVNAIAPSSHKGGAV